MTTALTSLGFDVQNLISDGWSAGDGGETIQVPPGDRRGDHPFTSSTTGPVITLQIFDTEATAIELANGVKFGLAGSPWTADVARDLRAVDEIDFGNVSINVDQQRPVGRGRHRTRRVQPVRLRHSG